LEAKNIRHANQGAAMFRIRTSIAALMAGVFFIAVAIASLLNPSPLWASCLFMFAVALMSAAILGICAGRQKTRMTWAGVAIFGWVYLGIVFGPLKNGNDTTIPALPTMIVYEYVLRERVLPKPKNNGVFKSLNEAQTLSAYNQIVSMNLEVESLLDKPSNTSTRSVLGDMMDLRRVVHSLGAIGFAFLGGYSEGSCILAALSKIHNPLVAATSSIASSRSSTRPVSYCRILGLALWRLVVRRHHGVTAIL
jgi:hypothetical protein